ncbi:MAG: putative quinol monooxygenase [Rhodospirillaceae bacterium]
MASVVLHVELTLQPGRLDEYLARARRHRTAVLANEPECSRFDISVPDDAADTVRLYEVYNSVAAFDHHMQTPYMQEYRADTGPMIADRRATRATLVSD